MWSKVWKKLKNKNNSKFPTCLSPRQQFFPNKNFNKKIFKNQITFFVKIPVLSLVLKNPEKKSGKNNN